MSDPPKRTPDVTLYDTGAVRYRGFQVDGQMHGSWQFLRKDGSLMRAGEFDRGQQVGVWRTFDRWTLGSPGFPRRAFLLPPGSKAYSGPGMPRRRPFSSMRVVTVRHRRSLRAFVSGLDRTRLVGFNNQTIS